MAYILIVDDDEDLARATGKVLTRAGHEVAIELDTRSAYKSLGQRMPDLMILDVMFPESSSEGFDFARKLRGEGGALKKLPILMLTAVNMKFPLGFSEKDIDDDWLPVTEFLEKPVEFDVLVSKVNGIAGAPGGAAKT